MGKKRKVKQRTTTTKKKVREKKKRREARSVVVCAYHASKKEILSPSLTQSSSFSGFVTNISILPSFKAFSNSAAEGSSSFSCFFVGS